MSTKHWMIAALLGGVAVGFFVTSMSNSGAGASIYMQGTQAATNF